jgi:hypothetical protein
MWRAVATGGGARLPQLRRDADGAPPDVLDAPGGRHHLPGRLHPHGLEPLHDRAQRARQRTGGRWPWTPPPSSRDRSARWSGAFGRPVLLTALVIGIFVVAVLPRGRRVARLRGLARPPWASSPCSCSASAQDGSPPGTAHRGARGVFTVLTILAALVGGVAEIVPSWWQPRGHHQHHQPALQRARAGGPRRLPARGLLHLPLADDPPVHVGDRTLRRGVRAGRLHLRPPVPVGLRASVRTSPAWAGSTRTPGTSATW